MVASAGVAVRPLPSGSRCDSPAVTSDVSALGLHTTPYIYPSPQHLCQALKPFSNFLKAAHVNAQSLFCHIDEFRDIFDSHLFDLIFISETWLKPCTSDKSVDLPGYSIFRNDRLHKGGGGVAVYIKSHLPSFILHSSNTSRVGRPEFMFLDVSVNGTHILVGICYRAPKLGYLSEFEQVLLDLMARYSHVIVMGDLNTDLLGPTTYDKSFLTTMFHSCNMTILPMQPTHHTATADTWLDVMAVSDPARVVHHGQLPAPGLSKHDLIFLVFKLQPPKCKPKYVHCRNYNNMDLNLLLADAQLLPWHQVVLSDNVDTMVNRLNYFLISLYDRHCPVTVKRVTKRPAPWLTDYIRLLQKNRDAAFRKAKKSKSDVDWTLYKRLRNYTQQQIRNEKARYYYRSFSCYRQSTKKLWARVKELGIGKQKIENSISIDPNSINDYFINIPVDLSDARNYVKELSVVPLGEVRHRRFSFNAVTEAEVLRAVMRMTSNAVGADNISIKFLKDTLPVTLPIICVIFNKSLTSSTFPSAWKLAVIRPLPKCSSPRTPSDFRPISILSALSKCLERVVHDQLTSFVVNSGILSNLQSGFRSQHSTTTALIKVTDDIRSAMDRKQLTLLTLFDFSKAFDCVFHPLLFLKLRRCGISDGCVDWVRSYLSDRRQCVRAGELESHWKPVTRGVPQGSVLGPLLFSLYIDDIQNVIINSKFHLYADDLQIYRHFSINDLAGSVLLLNNDIQAISSWANRHGLKLNENKTQVIIVGYSRLLNQLDMNTVPKLILNNHALNYCNKVKNLGLTITNTLGWAEQVTDTCNRVFAGIHSLKRFALYLPLNVKVLLVKTLILPHFNYCDVVINDMTAELSERLQRAQNYCIRFIFNLRLRDHVSPFYKQLSLMKLSELRNFHILSLLHAIIYLKSPSYLSKHFIFMSNISARETRRGASLLSIPIHRTSIFNKSFIVSACRLWNSLPDNVRQTDKRARFRAMIKDFLTRDLRGDGRR